ncbi:protein kinase domain-containing protein [Nocardia nepalensis]|uniref:serine/threonine-protein kinase n=1 Tax=Nocardia nepalensis TaxID=3375448 RepID=UPI003B67D7BB
MAREQWFGPYRLEQVLGTGGMGQVWRAYDTATRRYVALKVLPATLAQEDAYRRRFEREAEIAAGLSEPHVVPIHGFGEIDGQLYIDMALIGGTDLSTVLKERGPMAPAAAVEIIVQVAAALDAAHAADLVHRDVKPSNVVLHTSGFVYLIDFGIARREGQTSLTTVGDTVGTFAYMAPERFSGVIGVGTDVYALACVLYECLTARRPFGDTSPEQQVRAHLTDPPPRPSEVNAGVPVALDAVVARGMAKDPGGRYSSAGHLAAAARAALSPGPASPASEPTLRRPVAPEGTTRVVPTPVPEREQETARVPVPERELETMRVPAPDHARPPGAEPVNAPDVRASTSEAEPTEVRSAGSDQAIGGVTRSRPRTRRRLLLALAAVLIVASGVTGYWYLNSGNRQSPAELAANPGRAFDGTYDVTSTPQTRNGKPVDSAKYTRRWVVRSYCSEASGPCVASVTVQNPDVPGSVTMLVADYRAGEWTITMDGGTGRDYCTSPATQEPLAAPFWDRIVFRVDAADHSSFTGTKTEYDGGACNDLWVIGMALHRTGDVDPAVAVAAPEKIGPLVDTSPGAALTGTYYVLVDVVPVPGLDTPPQQTYRMVFVNICLRTGDRCAAAPIQAESSVVIPLVIFSGGMWSADFTSVEYCPLSPAQHAQVTRHAELKRTDHDPGPAKSLSGTVKDTWADPCPGTTTATIGMTRVAE